MLFLEICVEFERYIFYLPVKVPGPGY